MQGAARYVDRTPEDLLAELLAETRGADARESAPSDASGLRFFELPFRTDFVLILIVSKLFSF